MSPKSLSLAHFLPTGNQSLTNPITLKRHWRLDFDVRNILQIWWTNSLYFLRKFGEMEVQGKKLFLIMIKVKFMPVKFILTFDV